MQKYEITSNFQPLIRFGQTRVLKQQKINYLRLQHHTILFRIFGSLTSKHTTMKKFLIIATGIMALTACSSGSQYDRQQLTGNWLEILPADQPFVQGITINDDGTAASIGMATLQYEQWSLDGDRLILTGRSIGNGQTIQFTDTMNILRLADDTLSLGKGDRYVRDYCRAADHTAELTVNIIDSLKTDPQLGVVLAEQYFGVLPAASCPGVEYTVTIFRQANCGDGVFAASLNYLEAEEGADVRFDTYGRVYTLRGDNTAPNATVLQLISFDGKETMNFLYKGDKIEMLDQKMNRIESELNYTLER